MKKQYLLILFFILTTGNLFFQCQSAIASPEGLKNSEPYLRGTYQVSIASGNQQTHHMFMILP